MNELRAAGNELKDYQVIELSDSLDMKRVTTPDGVMDCFGSVEIYGLEPLLIIHIFQPAAGCAGSTLRHLYPSDST